MSNLASSASVATSGSETIVQPERSTKELADRFIVLIGNADETYFDVFFHPEYQKPHLVTDPVLGIQFPKSMATGIRVLNRKTIHSFTEESCRLFNANCSYYTGTLFGSTLEPGCTVPLSPRNES